MSQFKINSITDKSGYCGPVIAGVSTNNSTGCMIIPAGPTENRGGRGRGVVAGGRDASNPAIDTMDFIEIATAGNATDFGDLTIARRGVGSCSSPTRTVWGGGYIKPSNHTDTVDFIITQTGGNAVKFGELTVSRGHMAAVSSSTRGIWAGGSIYGPDAPAYTMYDTIDYVTLATEGNATDFGNLLSSRHFTTGTASNSIRGVWAGSSTPTALNTIEFVTIATTGNSTDFGDLTVIQYQAAGISDSHGGLG